MMTKWTTGPSAFRSASLVIGGLLLIPAAVPAGQGNAVTLRMKFKPGETLKYQTTMQMNIEMPMMAQAGGMKMDMSMVQLQKVLKALPNGGGDIEVTTSDTKMTMNGQPMNAPATPTITMTYDAQGNVKGVKGMPQAAGNPMMGGGMMNSNQMQMQGTFLPAKPVKPGDVWTLTVKMPGMTSSATVKGQYIKAETIGRYKTAKIRTVLSSPMNMMMNAQGQPTTNAKLAAMKMLGTMTMTMDTNFAISEGKMVRQAGNGGMNMTMKPVGTPPKGSPQMPNGMKMNMKMRMGSNLIE